MVFENNRLLRADEVGSVLNKKTGEVYRLTREGEFDNFLVRIGKKPTYRFRPDGLAEYIERGGQRQDHSQTAKLAERQGGQSK